MIFKKGELFCGPGGLALAAKNASIIINDNELIIEHAWANDIDKSACETYINNICPNNPDSVYCIPVQDLKIEKLPQIDAFTFGFPCNDFSVVGEQKGINGHYGPLYQYGVRVINHHNPKWFLAENVEGLSSANKGKVFSNILSELSSAGMGYRLTVHLYKFEEYGIPQNRHRIIIVGIRKDLGLTFKVPKPTHIGNYVTCRQAIEEPPIPIDAPNNELTVHAKKVMEMLNHIPPGKNAWHEGIPEHLRLKTEKTKISQIYKRLDPNEPAYTVTGSGGGGTHMYHWSEPRALTNRERARLQSFPDEFIFSGSKEEVRKQVGMAVPPAGAKIIFDAILKTFAGIEYDYIEPKWQHDNDDSLEDVI